MALICNEKATSALAGFPAGSLFWSNWNLAILLFVEGRKRENPEKNPWSKSRTNNKLNPHNYGIRTGPELNLGDIGGRGRRWWEKSSSPSQRCAITAL